MYCILRLQKIKTRAQLSACQNHNLRLKPVPNADPNKTHLNKTAGAADYKTLIAELEDKFHKHNIKPRKDAVQAVEVVLSASPEFFSKTPGDETIRKWANQNYKWAKEEFGENLIQFVLHLDESTPHIHLIFTPITRDGRLSMKELYGGKDKLSALQSRYAKAMEKFGLKRGNEGSLTQHTTIKEFYSFTNKLKKLNPKQIKKLANTLEEFEIENKKINEEEREREGETDFENLIKKIINANEKTNKPQRKTIRKKRGF